MCKLIYSNSTASVMKCVLIKYVIVSLQNDDVHYVSWFWVRFQHAFSNNLVDKMNNGLHNKDASDDTQ